jgi:hypothetical protein
MSLWNDLYSYKAWFYCFKYFPSRTYEKNNSSPISSLSIFKLITCSNSYVVSAYWPISFNTWTRYLAITGRMAVVWPLEQYLQPLTVLSSHQTISLHHFENLIDVLLILEVIIERLSLCSLRAPTCTWNGNRVKWFHQFGLSFVS